MGDEVPQNAHILVTKVAWQNPRVLTTVKSETVKTVLQKNKKTAKLRNLAKLAKLAKRFAIFLYIN